MKQTTSIVKTENKTKQEIIAEALNNDRVCVVSSTDKDDSGLPAVVGYRLCGEVIDMNDIESKTSIGNVTKINDLSKFTNLKDKRLKTAFEGIEKAKTAIRMSLITIGGILFDMRERAYWKTDFQSDYKSFDKFVATEIGIPRSSMFRYIGTYEMCCDRQGKLIPALVALRESQLAAFYRACPKRINSSDILAMIDKYDISPSTSPDEIVKTVNAYYIAMDSQQLVETSETSETDETSKSQNETLETSETVETSETTETAETVNMVMFKSTIKGIKGFKVPETCLTSAKDLFKYVWDHKPDEIGGKPAIAETFISTTAAYIIIRDDDMNNVLLYTYRIATINK